MFAPNAETSKIHGPVSTHTHARAHTRNPSKYLIARRRAKQQPASRRIHNETVSRYFFRFSRFPRWNLCPFDPRRTDHRQTLQLRGTVPRRGRLMRTPNDRRLATYTHTHTHDVHVSYHRARVESTYEHTLSVSVFRRVRVRGVSSVVMIKKTRRRGNAHTTRQETGRRCR